MDDNGEHTRFLPASRRLRQCLGYILHHEDDYGVLRESSPEEQAKHADMIRRAILILQAVHQEQTGELVRTDLPALSRWHMERLAALLAQPGAVDELAADPQAVADIQRALPVLRRMIEIQKEQDAGST